MRVVTGGDRSTGLGLDSSLDSALLNTCLGEGLREIYSDTVQQPLPPEFRQLLKQIEFGAGGRPSVAGPDVDQSREN